MLEIHKTLSLNWKELGLISEGTLLLTSDVSSLYSDIPNSDCIEVMADHLKSDRSKGLSVVPNHTNRFETKALTLRQKPMVWLSFINDTFIIWIHGSDKVDEFVYYLYILHPTNKFTDEYISDTINFLDISVKTDTNRTHFTTLYKKRTLICTYTTPRPKPM